MPGEPGAVRRLLSLCLGIPVSDSLPLPCFSAPAAHLLYQEYSDVVLNKEIQSQQRLDSLGEAPGPASPRQPRRALVSSESYLHRLSMASSGSLWQEIPVVRNSTVLLSMTHEDQKLQEVPSRARAGRGGAGAGWTGGKSKSLISCSLPPPPARAGCRHHTLPVCSRTPRLSLLSTLPHLNRLLNLPTGPPPHLPLAWATSSYPLLVWAHTK